MDYFGDFCWVIMGFDVFLCVCVGGFCLCFFFVWVLFGFVFYCCNFSYVYRIGVPFALTDFSPKWVWRISVCVMKVKSRYKDWFSKCEALLPRGLTLKVNKHHLPFFIWNHSLHIKRHNYKSQLDYELWKWRPWLGPFHEFAKVSSVIRWK